MPPRPVGMLEQHTRDSLLFKESRNVPYDLLVTEGFHEEGHCFCYGAPRTVIIRGVATYASVDCVAAPQNALNIVHTLGVGMAAFSPFVCYC